MKYVVDTNIIIDYYICSQTIDAQASREKTEYCTSLRNFLITNARDLLISDLSMREFMLKLIDKFLESLLPPPELGDRSLMEFTDELVKNIINSLGMELLETRRDTLLNAYETSRVINQRINMLFHGRDSRRIERRKLGRDIINIIHSSRNNAPLLTRDTNLTKLLEDIDMAKCKETVTNGLRARHCEVTVRVNEETIQTTLLLITQQ